MKNILRKWSKRLAAGVFSLCLVLGMGGVTAFAFVDEAAVAEAEEVLEETTPDETEATPFSVSGNGEVLDDISEDPTKEFYTITTANGNTFFLVIDKASSSENVYMLSLIDEYDLQDFIEEEETEPEETSTPVILEENMQTEETEEEQETEAVEVVEETSGGNGAGALIAVLLLAALGGGGAYYYIRIYKPKKEAEETTSEGLEYENYETRNEDMEDGEDSDEE
ncbi:MAG: DUF4366 domain-containing protein [Lachnospiraceae bacterium]|nr:DUF4366 domain-containing protein [Lachnospiraceae bacterium]